MARYHCFGCTPMSGQQLRYTVYVGDQLVALLGFAAAAWRLAGSDLSPDAALVDLRRIQRHTVSINDSTPVHGVSTVRPRQADVLAALNFKKPTHDAQLSLL